MFDHELNPLKGWPSPYAVDKRVQIDPSVVTPTRAGQVLYIDPVSGKAKPGTIAGAMALFAFQNQNDFDVNGDVGNIISNWVNCLVAKGAYELEDTEFVGVSFAPNDPLGVDASGNLIALVGGLAGANNCVGVISEAGPAVNSFSKNVIRFWPVFLPKR